MGPQPYKARHPQHILVTHLNFHYKRDRQSYFKSVIFTQLYERTTKTIKGENMNPLNFISSYNRKHTNNVAEIYTRTSNKSAYIPLYNQVASAGGFSPMHIEARLSADDLLVKNPMATYFVKVKGDSMLNAGIVDGDVVVVDRSLEPSIGHIVLAEVDGEFTVKYLGQQQLLPGNTNCQTINFADAERIAIIGVVTGSIRRFL